jgi:hypothetical protein
MKRPSEDRPRAQGLRALVRAHIGAPEKGVRP